MFRLGMGMVLTLVSATAFAPPAAQTETVVPRDEENVIASRLAGEWVPDQGLGQRMGRSTTMTLSITEDPAALERVPPSLRESLRAQEVYMTGRIVSGTGRESVFALVGAGGNPRWIVYRSKSGHEIDERESSLVMVVPAHDRANDALLIGGDFKHDAFVALKRKQAQ